MHIDKHIDAVRCGLPIIHKMHIAHWYKGSSEFEKTFDYENQKI